MRLTDRLKKKADDREHKDRNFREVAEARAALLAEREARRLRELEIARRMLEEKAEMDEIEAERKRLAEIERKTKEYFIINSFEQKLPALRNPVYFGEHVGKLGAWTPQGYGQLLLDDKVQREGNFEKGVMHGNSIFIFDDNSKWEGEMKEGRIHGLGWFTSKLGVRREALARNNAIMCYKDGEWAINRERAREIDINS